MLKSHETVSFPLYVWKNYSSYITEKELVLLGHFQAIPMTGKKAWEVVAERMGYKSISSVRKMLQKLQEKGCVVLNSYEIDATPFYNSCYEHIKVELIKKKEPKEEYLLARQVIEDFPKSNIHSLAGTIKKIENDPLEIYRIVKETLKYTGNVNPNTLALYFDGLDFLQDIPLMLKWMYEGNKQWAENKGIAIPNVSYFKINKENWNRWIKLGKPETYEVKKKRFTSIKK